jgi:threonine synthase
VFIKDEGLNPRDPGTGMSAAVTMARHYALKKLAAPSAGNAGGAGRYAAAAGIEAHIFMPKDADRESYGMRLLRREGHASRRLISDCARMVAERKEKDGWFDVSTLWNHFASKVRRQGYEVAEQLGWKTAAGHHLPDRRRVARSVCGRRSTKWNSWAGSVRSVPGW